jgi:hypothetical protein
MGPGEIMDMIDALWQGYGNDNPKSFLNAQDVEKLKDAISGWIEQE